MSMGSSSGSGAMADINVTPLVDVLLVLLIIFMVTAPIASYPIEVNLPQRSTQPPPLSEPPPPIRLRIGASGEVFWNDSPYPLSVIGNMMRTEVERDPTNQPQLEIDTNEDADYGILAKVLALAKNADMKKIGFVEN
ncbi:ExbD/TolR family protein [Novilysobacter antarcticus]|uniref:ExbD/TolR family protein n=1 Tax=Novilysobacter antarcticus TaxID=2862543 RepID=UPI001FE5F68B|nr:biopolymer transporter ExbD [Lysobacter antarcticus]